jgi:hypothetical protein
MGSKSSFQNPISEKPQVFFPNTPKEMFCWSRCYDVVSISLKPIVYRVAPRIQTAFNWCLLKDTSVKVFICDSLKLKSGMLMFYQKRGRYF